MDEDTYIVLISILEQLYRIITPSTSQSLTSNIITFDKSTVDKHLIVMTKLLYDPNAIYTLLAIPIAISISSMIICTLMSIQQWIVLISTIGIGVVVYYLQYKLIYSERNIWHSLQFAIKRSSEELKNLQGNAFEVDIQKLKRVRENILQAKKYLIFDIK